MIDPADAIALGVVMGALVVVLLLVVCVELHDIKQLCIPEADGTKHRAGTRRAPWPVDTPDDDIEHAGRWKS